MGFLLFRAGGSEQFRIDDELYRCGIAEQFRYRLPDDLPKLGLQEILIKKIGHADDDVLAMQDKLGVLAKPQIVSFLFDALCNAGGEALLEIRSNTGEIS